MRANSVPELTRKPVDGSHTEERGEEKETRRACQPAGLKCVSTPVQEMRPAPISLARFLR